MTTSDQDLRVGLLGCGFFGRSLAAGLREVPGAQLTAIADASEDTAQVVAAEFGAAATTPDRLLTDFDLDAVLIATPNALHREHAVAASEAGLHVFVEKPMALTTGDCRAMIDAAEHAGTKLIVGHVMRTLPAITRVKEMLDGGELGEIQGASGALVRRMNKANGPANWWKHDPRRSGGDILHEIHILDLLCWLLDPQDPHGSGDPDNATLAMRSGQALVSYEISSVSRFPRWGLQINGTKASVAFDMRAATLTVVSDAGTEVGGIFDDPACDASLVETNTRPSAHNQAGTTAPLWMRRAIELELADAVRVFRGADSSPLLEHPDRSVRIATSLF